MGTVITAQAPARRARPARPALLVVWLSTALNAARLRIPQFTSTSATCPTTLWLISLRERRRRSVSWPMLSHNGATDVR